MTSRRRRNSRALAGQALELGFAVPQVVAHRMRRIALAGPSPSTRDRKEFYLMSAEKAAAFFESWNAMLWEMIRANVAFTLSSTPLFWRGWPFATGSSRQAAAHWRRATAAVLQKGVAPVRRRAVANARRLSRKA
jgi:hypothetical protein